MGKAGSGSGRGRWTLRRRVSVLVVVVGLVLSGLAAGEATVAAKNREYLDVLLNKTGPLRIDVQGLLNAMVDQQNGVRGYAVTGDQRELGTYRDGVEKERELIASMDALLDSQPAIRRQLYAVRDQAEQWRVTVAVPAIDTTATSGTDAGQALLTAQRTQLFDQLRAAVDVLREQILELRNRVAEDARQSGNALVLLLIIAAVVVLVAGTALLTSLNRLIIGPVTALAAQVRQVAKGNYDRSIERVGPPELARLAEDIDGMRRKIAEDLAEVREARTRIEWVNSQLEKQAEELVRSNRDLEQFAYVASHDLQEPLRKVASFCQLLQRRYAGQLDERADQYIAFAVDGAQRMQRLINDLLAFSRIGRLTSGFSDIDLNQLMTEVSSQTETAQRNADGELTWSELPVVRGEEALLTNLLVNLVSNSLKFRRPDVPARVHVTAKRAGDEWEITCRDNGIGIEPEFADKIFVIFQRLHSKDAYPGTGIGLAIAKKIVEYHDGRIWAVPAEGGGTEIKFTLPAVASLDDLVEGPGAEEAETIDETGPVDQATAGTASERPAAETAGDSSGEQPVAGENPSGDRPTADENEEDSKRKQRDEVTT
ncbi:CHASE3 domain-containing protein [Micromonospora polyrhachis]|uniref:histidine kinase n=1 Tax=Micromonospora polyrhachis TaxID=1282883 RepID=A0A7W7WP64_9ACTN|nr:sensor histidine kinase [Micromonospora polyrhachis]MBB4958324.1 signal transduction histidine kinase [Micromonospora polyrhachis]